MYNGFHLTLSIAFFSSFSSFIFLVLHTSLFLVKLFLKLVKRLQLKFRTPVLFSLSLSVVSVFIIVIFRALILSYRVLLYTLLLNLIVSFLRRISPHSSPAQHPFRTPCAIFGQRLQARDLQDVGLRVINVVTIGYGDIIKRNNRHLVRDAQHGHVGEWI